MSCFFSCKQKTTHKTIKFKTLPYLSESRDTTFYRNSVKIDSLIYAKVPSFNLINQDSVLINDDFIADKIVLSEFFFTSCPSICPLVSKQLKRVYATYKDNDNFVMLSHSIDIENDTSTVLKAYANNLGVDTANWQFLTGDSKQIYDLANFGYLTTAYNDPEIDGIEGFMHSGVVVLVDENKIIRGLYDGKDYESVNRLIKDVAVLMK